ncbi:hypothetical protein SPRG_05639 [Saprolegnia parasitica CBS 223.65]|uniref:Uncharacterized protein n=1 Tax=Saprolegnia parasitica (strain CBS 223.65) TaxID=695850 RepID=A0A067CGV0_SAPPC|nr:hypothetical protein SPRG_05639 [Saprolegnia parasitica CBS 223.65]KDO29688.1 hypothetical protein SPRG_05639 [Saprolegnia parasitica CBS 223.65]|eukprot:XP_012199745.1 hypothetical protein SPRG_05639 [Saprolegnia parasitica CBS 223.65]
MAKVADVSAPAWADVHRFSLRRNRIALVISVAMLFNIASMPMKAYLSEYVPWSAPPLLNTSYANYSAFNSDFLAQNQRLYNARTLVPGTSYFEDAINDVQVLRKAIALPAPIHRASCLQSFLLGLPGVIYYTDAQIDLVCSLASATNVSAAAWHYNGSCFYDLFCNIEIGRSCLWLEAGDAIQERNASDGLFTLTYSYSATRFDAYLWFKFVYRLGNTAFVLYRMWTHYYMHCVDLERLLRTSGHKADVSAVEWRYELVLGDPTAIILRDPWVATAFLIDMWLSTGNNGDLYVMFVTFVYLSRTVWFAYCGLCVTAYCLKKWKKEHAFAEVDPTLVAIAIAFYGPLISWLSGNVGFLVTLYQWMFTCLVPQQNTSEQNELVVGCTAYTVLIAVLPVVYGFLAPRFQCWGCFWCLRRRKHAYSSHRYNNWKNQILLALLRPFRTNNIHMITSGGTVYAAYHASASFKNCPTFSLRSADCFVLCYHRGELREKMRLSFLSSLDTRGNTISNATTPTSYHFNELVETSKEGVTSFQLHKPSLPSVWCI